MTDDYIDFDKMDELADEYVKVITGFMSAIKSDLNDQDDFLELLVHFANSILKWIPEHEKKIESLRSTQLTKQEIAEIVIEAISSYKKSIEEINEQNIEEIRKKIDEANKQNSKEIGVYHTQIIQMFKDLIENVNKLNNKVDRLESISQKKEVADVATQTFANGLHSSNKKVYIKNILKEDLESEDNVLNNKKLGDENIANKKENNKTPLHTSEVNDTILEDITSEKNQRPTIKRQVVVNNQNQETKKLDLKAVMKESRKTTIMKYEEKVGNDYTKEQFKNNKEIGIGCKHRAFLRFDGGMTKLSMDVFEKDIKLEKDTYYFEREGRKYLVFRNIDSANADVPNDSFTLMKLPEGCQKFDNNIVVDVLNKARIDGIDGENSILIDSIEELQGLVVTDEKIKNKYFNEAKNRRVCSLLSSGDLMKTYTSEFEKDCKENKITNYKDYMPLNDGQLEFRSEKEIDNDIYIKPYVKTVENLLINSSEKNEKTSTAELGEKLKMYNNLNKNFDNSELRLVF